MTFSRIILIAALTAGLPAVAQANDLTGAWSGGGSFSVSGNTENARCNVSYNRASGSSYTAYATCATKSARVTQSANLKKVGGNEYSGSFYNNEYGVSGSIRIVVKGSTQLVSLEGGGGSGSFRLSKR